MMFSIKIAAFLTPPPELFIEQLNNIFFKTTLDQSNKFAFCLNTNILPTKADGSM